MAGDDEREAVAGAEAPSRPRRARASRKRREPSVGDDLAPRDGPRRNEQRTLETTEPRVVHGHVVVRDLRARQVLREPSAQIRHEPVTLP